MQRLNKLAARLNGATVIGLLLLWKVAAIPHERDLVTSILIEGCRMHFSSVLVSIFQL